MNRRIRQAFQESFALKVLAALVPVIVVSLIIYTAIGAMREGDKVKTGLIERGELYAGLLSHGAVVGIFAENTALLKDAAAGILRQRDVLSVSMYNADGKLLYEGSVTVPGKSPYQAPGKGTEQREGAMTQEIVETADAFEFIKHVSSKSLPGTDESIYLDDAGQRQAGQVIGFVRIVLSRDSYRKEIISLVARNAVMMLVFIVSIGAIVWFAVKNVMRPLEQLTGNVKALGEGLHVNAVPVETTDEVGKLASAFNAMVVARGMAEGSLRESEERYRRLVELSPDAVYVQQAEKIVFINAAGAKLMGASSAQQLVGSQATKFVHEHDRELVRKSFLHVAKEGTTVPFLLVGSARVVRDRLVGDELRGDRLRGDGFVGDELRGERLRRERLVRDELPAIGSSTAPGSADGSEKTAAVNGGPRNTIGARSISGVVASLASMSLVSRRLAATGHTAPRHPESQQAVPRRSESQQAVPRRSESQRSDSPRWSPLES